MVINRKICRAQHSATAVRRILLRIGSCPDLRRKRCDETGTSLRPFDPRFHPGTQDRNRATSTTSLPLQVILQMDGSATWIMFLPYSHVVPCSWILSGREGGRVNGPSNRRRLFFFHFRFRFHVFKLPLVITRHNKYNNYTLIVKTSAYQPSTVSHTNRAFSTGRVLPLHIFTLLQRIRGTESKLS